MRFSPEMLSSAGVGSRGTGSRVGLTRCTWCGEALEQYDRHPAFSDAVHFECGFRSVVGSVAHIEGRCSCFIAGSDEGDPQGMTKRQAAQSALKTFMAIQSPVNPDAEPEKGPEG